MKNLLKALQPSMEKRKIGKQAASCLPTHNESSELELRRARKTRGSREPEISVLITQTPVIFVSKKKLSSKSWIVSLVSSLFFLKFFIIIAIGYSRGLILCWNSSVSLDVIKTNDTLIHALVSSGPHNTTWYLTGVYSPPSSQISWKRIPFLTVWSEWRRLLMALGSVL